MPLVCVTRRHNSVGSKRTKELSPPLSPLPSTCPSQFVEVWRSPSCQAASHTSQHVQKWRHLLSWASTGGRAGLATSIAFSPQTFLVLLVSEGPTGSSGSESQKGGGRELSVSSHHSVPRTVHWASQALATVGPLKKNQCMDIPSPGLCARHDFILQGKHCEVVASCRVSSPLT